MKTFPVLLLAFSFAVQESFAQLSDDFADGELAHGPLWNGEVSDFIVNADQQLQLYAAAAGSSWLSTAMPAPMGAGVEWGLFIRQSFSPSGNNFARYYLSADQSDLSLPLSGYYLQFGEAGSNDAVELFRQSGTSTSSVCRGSTARIATSFAIRVKVVRYPSGLWELYIDYSGGTNYVLEATGIDTVHQPVGHLGLWCSYTTTNATRFFFDDVSVKAFDLPDTSPPQIESVEVKSSTTLMVRFNEPLDTLAADPENFFITPSSQHAIALSFGNDGRLAELRFEKPFENGSVSELNARGLKDVSGNVMEPAVASFLYFYQAPVSYRDIIMTEIYADPSPSRGLPDAEYVELYNRSPNPINVTGWLFSDGTTVCLLDSVLLLPHDYVLLTTKSSASAYPAGNVLGVSSFPSLNNNGDALVLKNTKGSLIDSLNYNVSWYNDSDKADGGWSLELIDVQDICDEEENWTASEAFEGGTPGKNNSVAASRPDNRGPEILSSAVRDSVTVAVHFSEKLGLVLPRTDQLTIIPSLPVRSMSMDETLRKLFIHFGNPIVSGVEYRLSITGVYDCAGNEIKEGKGENLFLLPQEAVAADVVINEILFNPRPAGVDFVEVYNRSGKTFDLKGWSIRNASSTGGIQFLESLVLRGDEYCVLTPDADILKGEYVGGVEKTFTEVDLPPLNDDEGAVVLTDENGVVIDSVSYSADMHSPFLKDDEGVSLERITGDADSGVPLNWRSASSTFGFATPGYVNSNARPTSAIITESIMVEPEIIQRHVPSRDFAQIRYRFDQGGFVANVRIYNQQGRSIRQIAQNELLGTEGFFRWDGDCDNGTAASTGYYLLWFEIFDVAGTVTTFRKSIAIY